ncbi:DMT family transporter [Jatrophihabitans endophyticus]|uniref:DMT family transporter n=1 Tax=Jatrophihabitans endophyticus TaxID=1206085 RepID=UPI001A0590AC|nr:DMT family transporter [Jatrophihabitans endophyticus]MBE7187777.1 DMT family transporter [Jatrophihabitans endophyticus]
MTVLVFPVGIAAAIALGLGYVLQQRVAATAPLSELMTFRLLLDLMKRRLWWAGIGSMVVGELLAGLALQLANVGLVEPLLSTNLLFALVFANLWCRRRICWQEVCGAVLLSAALGVFIAVGDPHDVPAPAPSVLTFVLTVASVLAAVGVLVAVARTRGLLAESVLLSIGAGLLYGLQDAGTRAALVVADRHGAAAMLTNPWAYIVVGAAVLGLLLSQSAFKAARLDYSLPPIAAAEPLAGVLLGVTVLGDALSVSIPGLAAEAACLAAMVAGVALIGRSPGLAGHHLIRRGDPEAALVSTDA